MTPFFDLYLDKIYLYYNYIFLYLRIFLNKILNA
nr:MAG TPA: hypothetical protein [Caudoviricetes sp.]